MDILNSNNDKIRNEIFSLKMGQYYDLEAKKVVEGGNEELEMKNKVIPIIEDISGMKIKIVEKIIYEKQKHIFPFKNWKTFDPSFTKFEK